MFPDGPGGSPGYPGYTVPAAPRPAPTSPAMTTARSATGLAGSEAAQRALWAQANGITPGGYLNDFGRMIMSQFNSQVRPWLGAMMAAGNPLTSTGDLIQQFAQQGMGSAQGFNDFLAGSTNAFLSNPTLMNVISRAPESQGAAQLASIIGLGQAPFDPIFGQQAREQFQQGFGQFQLGNLAADRPEAPGPGAMVDFLRSDPRFSWMLGQ